MLEVGVGATDALLEVAVGATDALLEGRLTAKGITSVCGKLR
jgi:hypothetical protein